MACTPDDSDFIRVLKQLVAVDFTDWFTNVAWSPSVTYCIVFLCLAVFFATDYNIILRSSCVFYSGKAISLSNCITRKSSFLLGSRFL